MSDKSEFTYVYLFLYDGCDWEDQKIFLHKEQAIMISQKYPNARVEIFVTNCLYPGYEPMYEYYKGGILYKKN
jgi:hypothetical protein